MIELIKSIIETLAFYFNQSDIVVLKLVLSLTICTIISIYIYLIYKYVSLSTFMDSDFGVSMIMISVIISGIVMVSKSNYAISLSAIGALSIVRFRTAIKNPMDLMFMFWAIGSGIICGAGIYNVAIIMSLFLTVGIMIMRIIPKKMLSTYLISINLNGKNAENEVFDIIKNNSKKNLLDTKNVTAKGDTLLVFEIKSADYNLIIDSISKIDGVYNVSLIHHDGEYNK